MNHNKRKRSWLPPPQYSQITTPCHCMLLRDELDQTLEMAEKQHDKQLAIILGLKEEKEKLKCKIIKLEKEIEEEKEKLKRKVVSMGLLSLELESLFESQIPT